jgi:protein TonB
MAQKTNIFNDAWCAIVFEDRNQDYGAFQLRKSSSGRHLFALVITSFIFCLAIISPGLIKKAIPERKEKMVEVTALSDLKLEEKKAEQPKEVFIDVPPPPPLRSTIKFTAPVITRDEEVPETEIIKTQEEVTKSEVKISIADIKGSEEEDAVDIADLNQEIVDDKSEPYVIVEQMPEFPGGMDALHSYIARNMKYPQIASENGISGRVFVTFVVNTNGQLTDIEVVRGISHECDAEAVRVIKSMPKWIAGRQNGIPVRVKFTVPIIFVLQ